MGGESGIRSLLARVRTLLSSMTVFNDSIHIGSISPSSTIHFGLSLATFDKSRIDVENRPKEITISSCKSSVLPGVFNKISQFTNRLSILSWPG